MSKLSTYIPAITDSEREELDIAYEDIKNLESFYNTEKTQSEQQKQAENEFALIREEVKKYIKKQDSCAFQVDITHNQKAFFDKYPKGTEKSKMKRAIVEKLIAIEIAKDEKDLATLETNFSRLHSAITFEEVIIIKEDNIQVPATILNIIQKGITKEQLKHFVKQIPEDVSYTAGSLDDAFTLKSTTAIITKVYKLPITVEKAQENLEKAQENLEKAQENLKKAQENLEKASKDSEAEKKEKKEKKAEAEKDLKGAQNMVGMCTSKLTKTKESLQEAGIKFDNLIKNIDDLINQNPNLSLAQYKDIVEDTYPIIDPPIKLFKDLINDIIEEKIKPKDSSANIEGSVALENTTQTTTKSNDLDAIKEAFVCLSLSPRSDVIMANENSRGAKLVDQAPKTIKTNEQIPEIQPNQNADPIEFTIEFDRINVCATITTNNDDIALRLAKFCSGDRKQGFNIKCDQIGNSIIFSSPDEKYKFIDALGINAEYIGNSTSPDMLSILGGKTYDVDKKTSVTLKYNSPSKQKDAILRKLALDIQEIDIELTEGEKIISVAAASSTMPQNTEYSKRFMVYERKIGVEKIKLYEEAQKKYDTLPADQVTPKAEYTQSSAPAEASKAAPVEASKAAAEKDLEKSSPEIEIADTKMSIEWQNVFVYQSITDMGGDGATQSLDILETAANIINKNITAEALDAHISTLSEEHRQILTPRRVNKLKQAIGKTDYERISIFFPTDRTKGYDNAFEDLQNQVKKLISKYPENYIEILDRTFSKEDIYSSMQRALVDKLIEHKTSNGGNLEDIKLKFITLSKYPNKSASDITDALDKTYWSDIFLNSNNQLDLHHAKKKIIEKNVTKEELEKFFAKMDAVEKQVLNSSGVVFVEQDRKMLLSYIDNITPDAPTIRTAPQTSKPVAPAAPAVQIPKTAAAEPVSPKSAAPAVDASKPVAAAPANTSPQEAPKPIAQEQKGKTAEVEKTKCTMTYSSTTHETTIIGLSAEQKERLKKLGIGRFDDNSFVINSDQEYIEFVSPSQKHEFIKAICLDPKHIATCSNYEDDPTRLQFDDSATSKTIECYKNYNDLIAAIEVKGILTDVDDIILAHHYMNDQDSMPENFEHLQNKVAEFKAVQEKYNKKHQVFTQKSTASTVSEDKKEETNYPKTEIEFLEDDDYVSKAIAAELAKTKRSVSNGKSVPKNETPLAGPQTSKPIAAPKFDLYQLADFIIQGNASSSKEGAGQRYTKDLFEQQPGLLSVIANKLIDENNTTQYEEALASTYLTAEIDRQIKEISDGKTKAEKQKEFKKAKDDHNLKAQKATEAKLVKKPPTPTTPSPSPAGAQEAQLDKNKGTGTQNNTFSLQYNEKTGSLTITPKDPAQLAALQATGIGAEKNGTYVIPKSLKDGALGVYKSELTKDGKVTKTLSINCSDSIKKQDFLDALGLDVKYYEADQKGSVHFYEADPKDNVNFLDTLIRGDKVDLQHVDKEAERIKIRKDFDDVGKIPEDPDLVSSLAYSLWKDDLKTHKNQQLQENFKGYDYAILKEAASSAINGKNSKIDPKEQYANISGGLGLKEEIAKQLIELNDPKKYKEAAKSGELVKEIAKQLIELNDPKKYEEAAKSEELRKEIVKQVLEIKDVKTKNTKIQQIRNIKEWKTEMKKAGRGKIRFADDVRKYDGSNSDAAEYLIHNVEGDEKYQDVTDNDPSLKPLAEILVMLNSPEEYKKATKSEALLKEIAKHVLDTNHMYGYQIVFKASEPIKNEVMKQWNQLTEKTRFDKIEEQKRQLEIYPDILPNRTDANAEPIQDLAEAIEYGVVNDNTPEIILKYDKETGSLSITPTKLHQLNGLIKTGLGTEENGTYVISKSNREDPNKKTGIYVSGTNGAGELAISCEDPQAKQELLYALGLSVEHTMMSSTDQESAIYFSTYLSNQLKLANVLTIGCTNKEVERKKIIQQFKEGTLREIEKDGTFDVIQNAIFEKEITISDANGVNIPQGSIDSYKTTSDKAKNERIAEAKKIINGEITQETYYTLSKNRKLLAAVVTEIINKNDTKIYDTISKIPELKKAVIAEIIESENRGTNASESFKNEIDDAKKLRAQAIDMIKENKLEKYSSLTQEDPLTWAVARELMYQNKTNEYEKAGASAPLACELRKQLNELDNTKLDRIIIEIEEFKKLNMQPEVVSSGPEVVSSGQGANTNIFNSETKEQDPKQFSLQYNTDGSLTITPKDKAQLDALQATGLLGEAVKTDGKSYFIKESGSHVLSGFYLSSIHDSSGEPKQRLAFQFQDYEEKDAFLSALGIPIDLYTSDIKGNVYLLENFDQKLKTKQVCDITYTNKEEEKKSILDSFQISQPVVGVGDTKRLIAYDIWQKKSLEEKLDIESIKDDEVKSFVTEYEYDALKKVAKSAINNTNKNEKYDNISKTHGLKEEIAKQLIELNDPEKYKEAAKSEELREEIVKQILNLGNTDRVQKLNEINTIPQFQTEIDKAKKLKAEKKADAKKRREKARHDTTDGKDERDIKSSAPIAAEQAAQTSKNSQEESNKTENTAPKTPGTENKQFSLQYNKDGSLTITPKDTAQLEALKATGLGTEKNGTYVIPKAKSDNSKGVVYKNGKIKINSDSPNENHQLINALGLAGDDIKYSPKQNALIFSELHGKFSTKKPIKIMYNNPEVRNKSILHKAKKDKDAVYYLSEKAILTKMLVDDDTKGSIKDNLPEAIKNEMEPLVAEYKKQQKKSDDIKAKAKEKAQKQIGEERFANGTKEEDVKAHFIRKAQDKENANPVELAILKAKAIGSALIRKMLDDQTLLRGKSKEANVVYNKSKNSSNGIQ